MRTLFLEHGIQTSFGTAFGYYIKKIYDNELKYSNRLLPKLTDTHFNYDTFQKMRVYLATQILSNSSSKAIDQMVEKGFFKGNDIPKAKATSHFCKKMNDLFDIMNGKIADDINPLKRGISLHTIGYLRELKEYVESFEQIKGSKVYCINGLKLTINAVVNYFDEKCRDTGSILLTRYLNQDPLENLFGEIRRQSHTGTNPDLLDVLRIMSRIITTKYDMGAKHRNVEWDASYDLSLIDLNQFKKEEKQFEDLHEQSPNDILEHEQEDDEWEDEENEEVCDCHMCLCGLKLIYIFL